MITTVLFDLDGTLLPMNQDVFVQSYFGELGKKLAPYGYEPKALFRAIWGGVSAMVQNDGSAPNETAFWNFFCGVYGEGALEQKTVFEEFYRVEFQKAKEVCGYNPESARLVSDLKQAGIHVALATNPIFPSVATESRIRWAGLTPSDFELYTTYENAHYSKPNLAYYSELLGELGRTPQECLMVGNDVDEDMVARRLGMEVFLLTDCAINKSEADISIYPHGSFEKLREYLRDELHILA